MNIYTQETSLNKDNSDDQHKLLDSSLQCSCTDNHTFEVIILINSINTIYIAKKVEGNSPVTVEIACSLSQAG